MSNQLKATSNDPVKVWDIVVRVSHWTVATCVLLNLLITEDGSDVHEIVGYVALVTVVIRLIWGFIGTRYARFSNFFPTPVRLKTHLRQLKTGRIEMHVGHNPVAALMMFALWGIIIGLGTTGILMGTDQFWGEAWLEEIHGLLANSLYLLVPVHVAAAIVMSRLQRTNLVKAMITGYKKTLSK